MPDGKLLEFRTLSLEQASAFLAPQLARYKLPRQLVCVPVLPKTSLGKVQKNQLRELLQNS